MDDRKGLPAGTVLPFPAMPCTLWGELGRGSNAIVYTGDYPDLLHPEERHTVLVKELFPFHPKAAIYRDEDGAVGCTPEGQEAWDLHRQSFEYGNRVHLRMLEKYPDLTGGNLNTFSLQGTLYTVLGYSGGHSLEPSGPETDLRRLTARMLGLLDALEAFHESGFLHLDISPDNILLVGQPRRERVMLIDYNSVYDLNSPAPPSYHSVKSGYSAPELRTGRPPSVPTDLYAVTAVFYRCLTGEALTPFQMSRPAPPDVSACPCLTDLPDTVSVMARQILRRGLQTLPRKRYPSTSSMREAFQELLDRIDGIGVTHWALWESGRKIVSRAIRENPSYAFLRDPDRLLPTRIRLPGGALATDGISALFTGEGRAALLTASGGMGKTTAMLRDVAERSRTYSPAQPAVVYLSLYGWKEGEPAYLRRRLLEGLRFKAEQYDAARHALDALLEKPLETRTGEQRPVLILLLDGLNEATGNTGPLIEEILSLSDMPGVRLVVSARGEEPALPFPRAELVPLTEEDVGAALSREGLLLPEFPDMRELLRTPLMLSIFLRSAENRQLSVATQEELLEAYFRALLEKEVRGLPEDSEARWQADAALAYVLPALAREIEKRDRALEDAELLPVVEQCYRLFSDPLLRRAFPQWIGHSQAIRGGAANAEEWYGVLVHDLLWKRLGLLIRDERGRYRVCHETIAAYSISLESGNARRLLRRRLLRRSLTAVVLLLCLAGGYFFYSTCIRPPAYSDDCAEEVLVYGLSGYGDAGWQYRYIRDLVDCAREDPDGYAREKDRYDSLGSQPAIGVDADYAQYMLERMLPTGKVFSWSRKPLDDTHYRELVRLAEERREEYEELAAALTYVVENERGNRRYGAAYPALLSELVETDADIAATLYELVCVPHLTRSALEENERLRGFQSTLEASISGQNRHLSGETDQEALNRRLLTLQGQRDSILNELRACGAIAAYELQRG